MPYVNIKIADNSTPPEKKAELIRKVTQVLADVLGNKPESTVVIIDEVNTDNWGRGGETPTQRRKPSASQ